jgi:hypothetical protein
MGIIRLIKPGLFLYECLRILTLGAVLILRSNETGVSGHFVYAAPGVLFPLMALFIWLDSGRYRAYLPLFAAGKCIGISTLLGWSIVSGQVTIIGRVFGAAVLAELAFVSGDLLALAAVLLIYKDNRKNTGGLLPHSGNSD